MKMQNMIDMYDDSYLYKSRDLSKVSWQSPEISRCFHRGGKFEINVYDSVNDAFNFTDNKAIFSPCFFVRVSTLQIICRVIKIRCLLWYCCQQIISSQFELVTRHCFIYICLNRCPRQLYSRRMKANNLLLK